MRHSTIKLTVDRYSQLEPDAGSKFVHLLGCKQNYEHSQETPPAEAEENGHVEAPETLVHQLAKMLTGGGLPHEIVGSNGLPDTMRDYAYAIYMVASDESESKPGMRRSSGGRPSCKATTNHGGLIDVEPT